MSEKKYTKYLNDIPRFSLGLVFLWFGIDKFTIHEFYVSWLSSTERVSQILPFDDISLSIYAIGIIELILAGFILSGLWIRPVSIIVVAFLVLTLVTAQYPSSYPQDIGLLGIAIFLVIANASWKRAQTEKFLEFLRIVRYSIAAVLFLWSIDQIMNFNRHVGWLDFSSPISEFLPVGTIAPILIFVLVVEIILGILVSIGKIRVTKYSLIALTTFLVFAVFFLEPPLKNHQSLGMAITTAWLAYIAFTKNKI